MMKTQGIGTFKLLALFYPWQRYWDTKSASSSLNCSHCRLAIAVNMGMIALIETWAPTGVILGSSQKYKVVKCSNKTTKVY